MPSTGRFQLTVGTVARAVGRINLLHDWIAPRLRRQRIRERYPFLRLKTKSKEEGRFTCPFERLIRQLRPSTSDKVFGVRIGAFWCKLVYSDLMSIAEKLVRQSISLPARVARQVKSLAKTSNTSANRVIVDLIESGIEAREQERKRFFELADRLARSSDAKEHERLKDELARMTFGE